MKETNADMNMKQAFLAHYCESQRESAERVEWLLSKTDCHRRMRIALYIVGVCMWAAVIASGFILPRVDSLVSSGYLGLILAGMFVFVICYPLTTIFAPCMNNDVSPRLKKALSRLEVILVANSTYVFQKGFSKFTYLELRKEVESVLLKLGDKVVAGEQPEASGVAQLERVKVKETMKDLFLVAQEFCLPCRKSWKDYIVPVARKR